MGDKIKAEFKTCNEMHTAKINERLEFIEGSISSLKNHITMKQNIKTENLATKVQLKDLGFQPKTRCKD